MGNGISGFESLKRRLFATSSPKKEELKKPARLKEVLIVDDEEPFLLSISDGLSIYRDHFNLLTATNGAEAVKILKSTPIIDLVVTDLSMPKMDGFELLAYMNRNFPKIPVILMTAFGTPKIEEIVRNMGVYRYLEKPLDINILADNIFEALSFPPTKTNVKPIESLTKQAPYAAISAPPIKPLSSPTILSSVKTIAIPKTNLEEKIETYNPTVIPESLETKLLAQNKEESASKISPTKTEPAEIMPPAQKKEQPEIDLQEKLKPKSLATFGARTSLSAAELQKLQEEARLRAEAKAKADMEKKIQEEAEKKAKLAAKLKADEEKEAKAEAERRLKEETKARQEEEKRAKAKAEEEKRAREEAERKAREEAERKAREEAERKAREEAERKAREEAERKAREEAERKAREEALLRAATQLKAKQENMESISFSDNAKTDKDLKSKIESDWKVRKPGASEDTKQKINAWIKKP